MCSIVRCCCVHLLELSEAYALLWAQYKESFLNRRAPLCWPPIWSAQGGLLHLRQEDGGWTHLCKLVRRQFQVAVSTLARGQEFATLDASVGYCFKLMIEGEPLRLACESVCRAMQHLYWDGRYDWPYYSEESGPCACCADAVLCQACCSDNRNC